MDLLSATIGANARRNEREGEQERWEQRGK
jgi:hypothetical protein